MKTPADKTVTFTYMSYPVEEVARRWSATLAFPAGADETAVLQLDVVDGERQPVTGALELAGRKIPVTDGKGTLAYADFIRGKHEPAVWLHRTGDDPVPGGLTFA